MSSITAGVSYRDQLDELKAIFVDSLHQVSFKSFQRGGLKLKNSVTSLGKFSSKNKLILATYITTFGSASTYLK